jgi:hypothetical protein
MGIGVSTALRYASPPLAVGGLVVLIAVEAPPYVSLGLMPVLLVLLVEVLVAEYRGVARPRQVAWAAAWAFLPWGIVAGLLSWFVPLGAWLLALGFTYFFRTAPTATRPVAEAWREATTSFGRRRSALGRHYRWRVALAAFPHFVYVFSLSFLLMGVAIGVLGAAHLPNGMGGGALGGIGLLIQWMVAAVAFLVALPVVSGVVGIVVAPFVRGPFGSLLRVLLGLDAARSKARGCVTAVLVLCLDALLYVVGFGWAGITFIGSAFPGGGSTGASLTLVPLLAVLGLRVLVGDAMVLESDRIVGGPARLLRAALSGPGQLIELALWQLTIAGLFLFLPLIGLAGLTLALRDQPPWLVGLVGLAGILVIARLGAATLLRLSLHRLVLLRQLAPASPAPISNPEGVVGA